MPLGAKFVTLNLRRLLRQSIAVGRTVAGTILILGAIVKEILKTMESITPKLQELEALMTGGDFSGKSATELLGSNPQLAISKLVEFKAALDRMRGLTWVYMEAASGAGRLPAERMPQPLREFLQQEAAKTQAAHSGKKSR